MKNFRLVLALLLILVGGVFTSAQADATADAAVKPKPTEGPSTHLSRREILNKLQLTDAQRQQLRKTRAIYRKKIAQMDGQLKIKKVDLENEMDRPDPDAAKLDAIANEIGDIYGHKISEKIKAELELEKKILTPQQVELLRTLQGKESTASEEIL